MLEFGASCGILENSHITGGPRWKLNPMQTSDRLTHCVLHSIFDLIPATLITPAFWRVPGCLWKERWSVGPESTISLKILYPFNPGRAGFTVETYKCICIFYKWHRLSKSFSRAEDKGLLIIHIQKHRWWWSGAARQYISKFGIDIVIPE